MDRLISLQAAVDAVKSYWKAEVDAIPKDADFGTFTATCDLILKCNTEMCKVLDGIPSAQPEQQWIPCSEHPDTDRNVFIARGKTDFLSCCIGHYDHNAKLWYEDRNWFAKIMYDAMYWCEMPPLPEPWKGEEHETCGCG